MPDWVFQAAGLLALGVGGYVAVRADLAALRVKAEMALQRADGAHVRIDGLLFQRKGG